MSRSTKAQKAAATARSKARYARLREAGVKMTTCELDAAATRCLAHAIATGLTRNQAISQALCKTFPIVVQTGGDGYSLPTG